MFSNIKIVFAISSALITIGVYYPYIRDIFQKKTKPHLYSWLLWSVTQIAASIGIWYGGGKFGAIGLSASAVLTTVVFLLSIKYGTKNITRSDTLVLSIGLFAILIWLKLKDALIAVMMASFIDGLGYLPTYRKSFIDPWSETMSYWIGLSIAGVLSLLANDVYNPLTVTYLSVYTVANSILLILCITRRKIVHDTHPKNIAI